MSTSRLYRRIAGTVIAVALAFASSAQAGSALQIDPNGATGGTTAITVGSLDWNVGSALLQNVSTSEVQIYNHAGLSGFNDPANTPIAGTGLNSAFEWTYSLGTLTSNLSLPGFGIFNFPTIAGGDNFFRIYYDPAKNAADLAGTGFNDGTLILEGTIQPDGVNNFLSNAFSTPSPLDDGGPGNPLDAHGVNQTPLISSINGNGGSNIIIGVTFFDPNFFLTPPTVIEIDFTSNNHLNFNNTDPSLLFFKGDGSSTPGATVASVGTCNGCPGETAPNVIVQVDGSSSFTSVKTPLPGSLALIGSGLGLLLLAGGGVLRRRLA